MGDGSGGFGDNSVGFEYALNEHFGVMESDVHSEYPGNSNRDIPPIADPHWQVSG
ncbi:hypothetical protein D3C87_2207660 [compost metagenome]